MPSNEELLLKAVTSSGLSPGGQLSAEQEDRFIMLQKKYNTFLGMIRLQKMRNNTAEINKLHIGEPITTTAGEDTDDGESREPKFGKEDLVASKTQVNYEITTETFIENIEQQGFEEALFKMITEQHSSDLSTLFVQGDVTITGTDKLSKLLKRLDGVDILSAGGHTIDAAGAPIGRDLFREAWLALPKSFRQNPNNRFMTSSRAVVEWMDLRANRQDDAGVAALQGAPHSPFGFPLVGIPEWPEDQQVTGLSAAQAAVAVSTEFGPIKFTAAAHNLRLSVVWNSAANSVDFTTDFTSLIAKGAVEMPRVANAINTRWLAVQSTTDKLIAEADESGRLKLTSPGTGTGDTIALAPAASDDAQSLFGFTETGSPPTIATGSAANAGVAKDGTFMLLTDPRNIVWGRPLGTRVYVSYNQKKDRVEVTIYSHAALAIENFDILVKVINIRPLGLATTPTLQKY